ncbi:ArdC-like ssDNA-binding domain-containing protein [Nocardioides sp. YIM B13467]|uniref:ArdC-like ssDNA-binding domain-containing protein n=1 Tax=Nocardioides sp. YIM B13467 TaxID=3366294 RepID=UPI00367085FD
MWADTNIRTDRGVKLEALQERLTVAVGRLVTGHDWRKAVEFSARFRSRSFRNSALIAAQHLEAHELGLVPGPYPTYVAGFKQWQSLGRSIVKGQHGYQIFAPVKGRFASDSPSDPESWRRLNRGEKPWADETVKSKVIGLRLAYVFDISQTEGDPIPEPPRPKILQGAAPDGLWDGLADQITDHGFELRLVSDAQAIFGRNGQTDYLQREVSVRMDMDEAAQVKTLCHELAHVMLHGNDPTASLKEIIGAESHRGIQEVEAESVAAMVSAAHGLDTSSYSIPYVATWATHTPGSSPVEVVQATAERVRRTAISILDGLDTEQIGNGDPPGLTRNGAERDAGVEADSARAVRWTKPSKQVGL